MKENKIIKKSLEYAGRTLTLEAGRVARQAAGSVMVSMGDTTVLATATVGNELAGAGFMPLTVHYQERFYAVGRIPGGFFRREGRPSEKETLLSRLIDRPLRPLFASGFCHEVLVTCTVMSMDPEVDGDMPAMIGASAALALSGLPWAGPIGCARVGFQGGKYFINSAIAKERMGGDAEKNRLNMMLAGTKSAVLMVESEADGLSEQEMLDAVLYGHEQMQAVIKTIDEMVAEAKVKSFDWELPSPAEDADVAKQVQDFAGDGLEAAYQIVDKRERNEAIARLRQSFAEKSPDLRCSEEAISAAFRQMEKKIVRARILGGKPRIDGRDLEAVRPISGEAGLLPRAHGSALFTRGETQAIGTVTLGAIRDAQMVDLPEGKYEDPFMLHYNFPPYSVGEAGRMGPPGRREIGHGRLARRAIESLLPDQEQFPYVIRVVSEVTESNGSSSMASVCVGSLALMDAGVPLRSPVAGVAMGLVKEGDEYAVLTDILGDEDHLGDMDFKVAGTKDGVNALQMDIKILGIDAAIMRKALEQARVARLHILKEMARILEEPRATVSEHAPGCEVISISADRIRDLIGKGGETIRAITTDTGTSIDVEQDGTVRVYGETRSATDAAIERIKTMTMEIEVGMRLRGEVRRITDFGAFVNVMPGKDGLVHISQIANRRVDKVSDYLSEGDMVSVKVIGIDDLGRIKLSIKELAEEEEKEEK